MEIPENDEETVNKILNIRKITRVFQKLNVIKMKLLSFDFPTAKVEDINKINKFLNLRKATGSDGIPVKILKIVRNVTDLHLTYIIIRDIKESKFLEDAKTPLARPLYKKNDRDKVQNHRPVSI